ncbi:MAG: AAA family ATPase [Halioglobus sp.]
MYLEHFGLNAKPFNLNPDPAYLFLSSQHSLAYHMLEYGLLSQPGITVISGEVGAGKTTLLRHLIDEHDDDSLVFGFITDTEKNAENQLLSWVSMAFGLDHSGTPIDLKKRFQQFLIDNYARGKQTALIVDEAQNLGDGALEQLRVLNNINSGQDELLKIILVGQPELLDQLQHPDLMQIAQRVSVEFHLSTLKADDSLDYIRHRLKVAGATYEIFDELAMYCIYYLSGGVPRLINTLCDFSLVFGYSSGKKKIGIPVVLEVAKGRKIGGVNRQTQETDEMLKARNIIRNATGYDITLKDV